MEAKRFTPELSKEAQVLGACHIGVVISWCHLGGVKSLEDPNQYRLILEISINSVVRASIR